MNVFDYLNSINHNKTDLVKSEKFDEKEYNPFIVNKGLSYFIDTIIFANDMNMSFDLNKKAQYLYLLNSVRPRKRYSKWFKKDKAKDVEWISEHYGYSHKKSKEILEVLNKKQISLIKEQH
tara:strand:- start:674 stop:1036 length:363 start_codon:yes stop_codon:yes gene_type:complete